MPVALEGLADLFTLLAWGIALSLLYIWRFTVGALIEHLANLLDKAAVRVLGHTIHFLGPVSAGLRAVDAAIQTTLAEIAHGAERATVFLFHKSLAGIELFGHELWSLGYDIGGALERLTHKTLPAAVRAASAALIHELHALPGQIRHETAAALRPLMASVHRLEATVAHDFGIARRGIDVTKRDLARAEKATARLGSRVTTLEKALGAAVFTGLFVRTLERIGLKWLRCPSLGNIGRKTGCQGFKFLEDLLFGVIDVLVIVDLCRITRLMVDAAESAPVKDALHAFIDGMDDLLDCRGLSRPHVWTVRRADLPPLQAWSALPPVG